MRSKIFFLILSLVTAFSLRVYAGNPDIIKEIQKDSVIIVEQPAALTERLRAMDDTKEEKVENTTQETDSDANHQVDKTVGYRVQVFSDNNIRTAKAEARKKAAAVAEALPQYRTYVSYESPFWRLRVGDFRSKIDATEAADEIKRAFPNFSREIRVVRDRVNL